MSRTLPFASEKKMAALTVNLDALIPRADFESNESSAGGVQGIPSVSRT